MRGRHVAGLGPIYEALKGNGGDRDPRGRRLERPEMIPLIAPALNDGVGIRPEAANARPDARIGRAVIDVQKLLLARAAPMRTQHLESGAR